jgi:hypothetical protein
MIESQQTGEGHMYSYDTEKMDKVEIYHEGNAMGYYDFANRTLVEYQIPSKSVVWGNTSNPCRDKRFEL